MPVLPNAGVGLVQGPAFDALPDDEHADSQPAGASE
jgi:hypothetical protein